MRSHRSVPGLIAALVGVAPVPLVLATASPALAADPAGALGNVVVNEVSSNGFAGGDFIELYNKGTTTIDLTGYHLKDNKTLAEDDVLLDGKIAPQGYAVFSVDNAAAVSPKPFGLGSADEANLLSPDGATVIDSYSWTTHVTPSFARTPDGTGTFAVTTAPTPGGPNALTTAEAQVTLNEVFTDGAGTGAEGLHDFAEVYNGSSAPVDLTGWYLTDGAGTPTAADRVTLGGSSATLAAGGYLAVETELMDTEIPAGFTYLPASNGTKSGFGLNKTDWVFLYKPDGTLVSTTFKGLLPDEHANTWSRVRAGTGLWKNGANQTPGAVNTFPGDGGGEEPTLDPNWDDVEINEIASLNADDPGNPGFGDAVELKNTGANPVSIEGWYQVDSGAASGAVQLTVADLKVWNGSALVAATDLTIPSGGYVTFTSKKGLSGEGDAVKVYGPGADPAGRQLVDEQAYGDGDAGVSDSYDSDARAFAACPDGGSDFWRVTENSFGRDNTASCTTKSRRLDTPVVLNEVANVAGKVELLNTGVADVDISGWQLLDAAGTVVHTVPAATTLAPGAFYVGEGITGLDSVDSLTIRRAGDQASVVAHTWHEDGIASYSRCELFGTVSYVETPVATFGAANACPSLDTQAWPGAAQVATVDEVNGFGDQDGNGEGDVSGAAFDPSDPSILWVVQNKNTLHKMHKVGGSYVAVDGWTGGKKLHFASGTGKVDSEGVTVGPDGSVYVTSERDNDNSGVSSNKIERYDVSGVTAATTDLTASREWDVNSFVTTGTNLGLEGITYVPDAFLVGAGWKIGGNAYTAATYPTPGLFVTAVEETGNLHFFSLANGVAPVEAKVEKSGFPWSMDVAYDADRDRLWALCDDGCGGVYNLLDVVDGDLAVEASYARPGEMPNLNNEGMAIAPASTCVDGVQEVVWADDGDTDGFSLRAGGLPCPPAVTSTVLPKVTGTAKVGFTLTGTAGTWSATPTSTSYQWLANGAPIAGATAKTLKVGPTLVGKKLSLKVVVAAEGRLDGTAISAQTAAVARGQIKAGNPRISGTPKVGRTLTAMPSAASPATPAAYQWFANGKALAGRKARTLRLTGALRGKRIAVRVTYGKAGYATLVRTSAAVKVRR